MVDPRPDDRLLLPIREAARLLGISDRHLFSMRSRVAQSPASESETACCTHANRWSAGSRAVRPQQSLKSL